MLSFYSYRLVPNTPYTITLGSLNPSQDLTLESSLLSAIPHFILAIALLTEPYLPILEDGTLVQTHLAAFTIILGRNQ